MKEPQPLDRIEAFLRRFLHLPTEADYVVSTLWIAHTYFTDRISTTPRLAIISPEYGCGKSRFVEILQPLCFKGEKLEGYTRSYLMRQTEMITEECGKPPTLLVDEIDSKWGHKSEEGEMLRAFINSGYRDTGFYGLTEGEGKNRKPTKFRVFAPVAMAGKGEVLPDSVKDRSIIVRLQKRPQGKKLEKFLNRKSVEAQAEGLSESLSAWSEGVGDEIRELEIPLPVSDREEEIWLPLASVAYVAGGEWPQRLLEALSETLAGQTDTLPSREREILADVRSVWPEAERTLRSVFLIEKLLAMEDREYSSFSYGKPINEKNLAKFLTPYGIKPRQIRFGSVTFKGYERAEVEKACANYLDFVPVKSETTETEETFF